MPRPTKPVNTNLGQKPKDAPRNVPYGIKGGLGRAPEPAHERLYFNLLDAKDDTLKQTLRFLHSPEMWLEAFNHPATNAARRSRLRRIVQMGTIDVFLRRQYFRADGQVKLSRHLLNHAVRDSLLHNGPEEGATYSPRCDATEIMVIDGDALQVAHWLQQTRSAGRNVCVLNPASATRPGGGYRTGASAMEEGLCRRTNLFMCLEDPWQVDGRREWQYPLPEYGGAYCPDVTVVRDAEQNGYGFLAAPFTVSFVSAAALTHPQVDVSEDGIERLPKKVAAVARRKIVGLLDIAYQHCAHTLVLPAWGCGAYANPPGPIASLFHDVLNKEFRNCFNCVAFAITSWHHCGKAFAGALLPPGTQALKLRGIDSVYTIAAREAKDDETADEEDGNKDEDEEEECAATEEEPGECAAEDQDEEEAFEPEDEEDSSLPTSPVTGPVDQVPLARRKYSKKEHGKLLPYKVRPKPAAQQLSEEEMLANAMARIALFHAQQS